MPRPAPDHSGDLTTIRARWEFEYEYFAGATASRFFRELRDRRIMGTLCPGCGRTLVPARAYCDACFEATTEWREIGTRGTLETFTILVAEFPGLPAPPLALGYVTLEGADTALLNFVQGVDLADVEAAARLLSRRPAVDAVFHEQPEGRITDFHFEVVP